MGKTNKTQQITELEQALAAAREEIATRDAAEQRAAEEAILAEQRKVEEQLRKEQDAAAEERASVRRKAAESRVAEKKRIRTDRRNLARHGYLFMGRPDEVVATLDGGTDSELRVTITVTGKNNIEAVRAGLATAKAAADKEQQLDRQIHEDRLGLHGWAELLRGMFPLAATALSAPPRLRDGDSIFTGPLG